MEKEEKKAYPGKTLNQGDEVRSHRFIADIPHGLLFKLLEIIKPPKDGGAT